MKKVWLVYNSQFGDNRTGTAIRNRMLTELARTKGNEVVVVGKSFRGTPPPGVEFLPLSSFDPSGIGPSDYVLVSGYLPSRAAWKLIRSAVGFDVDFSCITAPEVLESRFIRTEREDSKDRKRRRIRYSLLCRRADRVVLSSDAQLTFLAGVLYSRPGRVWADLAATLPNKVEYLPMAVGSQDLSHDANPYPLELQDKKVFLWGGGIWPWMDYRKAIDAFSQANDPGPGAPVLFFLVGRNSSEVPWLDRAVADAREYATAKGCLDRTVFFNARNVVIDEAPAYVRYCHAGILGNKDCLESRMSWRTRLLDLMAFGKPAMILGKDPLGALMERRGAAVTDQSEPGLEPSRLVGRMSEDATLYNELCTGSRKLGEEMTWEKVFSDWPYAPLPGPKPSLGWIDALRYVLSI